MWDKVHHKINYISTIRIFTLRRMINNIILIIASFAKKREKEREMIEISEVLLESLKFVVVRCFRITREKV